MNAVRWCAVAVLSLSFCTVARSDTEALAYLAIAADVATTLHALDQGAEESNPLYGPSPSDGAVLLGGAARVAGVYMVAQSGYRHRDRILRVLSYVTFAAAGNNLAVASGKSRIDGAVIGLSIPLFADWMMR